MYLCTSTCFLSALFSSLLSYTSGAVFRNRRRIKLWLKVWALIVQVLNVDDDVSGAVQRWHAAILRHYSQLEAAGHAGRHRLEVERCRQTDLARAGVDGEIPQLVAANDGIRDIIIVRWKIDVKRLEMSVVKQNLSHKNAL